MNTHDTAAEIVRNVGITDDPSLYFDRDGLRALTVADAITEFGPLAEGIDDRIWAYERGVWRPAKNAVRDRAAVCGANGPRRAYESGSKVVDVEVPSSVEDFAVVVRLQVLSSGSAVLALVRLVRLIRRVGLPGESSAPAFK